MTSYPVNDQAWPKISVVTISYNQGRFLEEAILSVLHQDYPNLEYIVIDGGSSDNSVEILNQYAGQLTYWHSQPDTGPAAALNKGFAHASGEILAFLNADDLYLPGTLARVAALFAGDNAADVIYGDGYLTDSNGKLRKPTFSDPWNLQRLAYGSCTIVQPATFFKRDAFRKTQGFNESHKAFWDATLWVDMARAGAEFHYEREFMAVFRLHGHSITGSGREDFEESRVMDEIFEKVIGRPRRASDRIVSAFLRLIKFLGHPLWSLDYNRFLRSIRDQQVTD
jgi:glycosyltransferase involved in cell wall biosynthesis